MEWSGCGEGGAASRLSLTFVIVALRWPRCQQPGDALHLLTCYCLSASACSFARHALFYATTSLRGDPGSSG